MSITFSSSFDIQWFLPHNWLQISVLGSLHTTETQVYCDLVRLTWPNMTFNRRLPGLPSLWGKNESLAAWPARCWCPLQPLYILPWICHRFNPLKTLYGSGLLCPVFHGMQTLHEGLEKWNLGRYRMTMQISLEGAELGLSQKWVSRNW